MKYALTFEKDVIAAHCTKLTEKIKLLVEDKKLSVLEKFKVDAAFAVQDRLLKDEVMKNELLLGRFRHVQSKSQTLQEQLDAGKEKLARVRKQLQSERYKLNIMTLGHDSESSDIVSDSPSEDNCSDSDHESATAYMRNLRQDRRVTRDEKREIRNTRHLRRAREMHRQGKRESRDVRTGVYLSDSESNDVSDSVSAMFCSDISDSE